MLRTHALALPLLLVLTLAGCGSPPQPRALDSTTAPSTPRQVEIAAFVDALAAYQNFVSLSDLLLQDASIDIAALDSVATGDFLADLKADVSGLRNDGVFQVGASEFRDFKVWETSEGASEAVIAVVCNDLHGTDLRDSRGKSIIDPASPSTFFSVVVFDRVDGDLRVSRRFTWDDREC